MRLEWFTNLLRYLKGTVLRIFSASNLSDATQCPKFIHLACTRFPKNTALWSL